MSPAGRARLCALVDLQVVRGRMGDEGFRELTQKGYAKRRYIPHTLPHGIERCDYILTEKGKEWSRWLLNEAPWLRR